MTVTPPLNARIARAVAHWEAAWRERFEERAAILEYDAGRERGDAEERAFLAVDEARRKAIPQGGNTPKRRGA